MIKEKIKIFSLRNGLVLAAVSYMLYLQNSSWTS